MHWFLGEGNGYLLQYSCLENSTDRRAWQATVHGSAKSQTQLSTHVWASTRHRYDRFVKIYWIIQLGSTHCLYLYSTLPGVRLSGSKFHDGGLYVNTVKIILVQKWISAIHKDVDGRRDVIQSEVSQKEKNKHHVLMHSRAAPGKSGLHARGEGERVMALESW